MTPIQFWHCTPRKLAALAQVHADMNDPKKHSKKKQMVTADGVPLGAPIETPRSTARPKGGGVGAPDTHVDRI